MSRFRILIAVCSAAKYGERRNACRETWVSRLPEDIGHFFFIGDVATETPEPDTVNLAGTPDDYAHLTLKTVEMLRHAATRDDFDYLFKCDDDTYVAGERLTSLIVGPESVVGFVWQNNVQSLSGGAGYLLHRTMLTRVAEHIDVTGFYEDVEVTKAARAAGLTVVHNPRLQPGHGAIPSWKNDRVTSHWCKPRELHTIHAAYDMSPENIRRERRKEEADAMVRVERPELELHLRHRDWTDHVRFYSNGLFSRASTACRGEWTRDAGGEIRLDWFDWAAETIRPVTGSPDDYEFVPY